MSQRSCRVDSWRHAMRQRRAAPKLRDHRLCRDGGFFFNTDSLYALRTLPKLKLQGRADWGTISRTVAEVKVYGEPFLVDIATGSLYRMDGSSASGSTMRLNVGVRK